MKPQPIYATVPSSDPRLPALPNALKERRKPGRVPGKVYPKKPKLPLDEFDVNKLRTPIEPGHCPGCQQPTASVSFELVRELVKSSRDRAVETEAEQRAKAAEHDLFYLAARLEGFCSLGCWRRSQPG